MSKVLWRSFCGVLLCVPMFLSAQTTEEITTIAEPVLFELNAEEVVTDPAIEIEMLENSIEVLGEESPVPTLYTDDLTEKETFVDTFAAIFAIIMTFITYVVLPIGSIILIILGSKKNWNEKKKKTKMSGYAGFWKRVAIKFFDKLINIAIVPIFFSLYYYCRDGQTIGDKVFGGKIVDKDTYTTASVGKLFVRIFAKFFSWLALGIGFWPAGWRKEKNAWHDSLSDTRYISTKRVAGGWIVLTIVLAVALPFLVIVPVIMNSIARFGAF